MKLARILAMPFTLVADVVTLGNMWERSFTQQLFDAEERERREHEARKALDLLAALAKQEAKP